AAFEGCFVEELTLPSTIKAIGEAAFDECGLTQLSLNEGLEVIGEIAFFGNDFAELHLPSTVKKIGDRAFGNPAGFVRHAVIPTGLEEIGNGDECHIFGEGFDVPECIELYGAPVADWNLWWPILAFMEGEVLYPADWKESDLPDRRIFALYPGVDPEMAEEEDFGQIWTPKEE
ncbi:MAG: leucine-rich repeat domain-containing protein, partial [Clostridia bacterium]|nr:leucine-rich repeat domain-containing protein [Clostridia bacterium]